MLQELNVQNKEVGLDEKCVQNKGIAGPPAQGQIVGGQGRFEEVDISSS